MDRIFAFWLLGCAIFASDYVSSAAADARDSRHCHNIHTRTYCHKRDSLPVNWPPLTNSGRLKRLG